ncbi:molybdopterin-dependent oxidoreductase [Pseudomonas sp. CGJS7]|uniref:molybdopterin-dependent oxidoreductase n=1 Tax=Pseudomonas sp. CGJS7 TaxID=3109348 RepID=UPI003009163E
MAVDRRAFVRGLLFLAAGSVLAGYDRISRSQWGPQVLNGAEALTSRVQRLLSPQTSMAEEFAETQVSKTFPSNGTSLPSCPGYRALLAKDFADYRLRVDGLVKRPADLSIAELRAIDEREQITRHDCVQGWSAIGKWQGTSLAAVLDHVLVDLDRARFAVFHCFDEMKPGLLYYESLDLEEARHPQTLLAYALNGAPLPVANGAPLRLRVERQLGYKHAKYLSRIELVHSLADIHGGHGGYYEDTEGREWYAGI